MRNVHLYGLEHVPPCEGDDNDATGRRRHHHHGSVRSHGWVEALGAVREVGRGLAATAPRREGRDGVSSASEARTGVFAFYGDMLVFPYLTRP